MKVKDLIEMLKEADPESDVNFKMISGCCGDFEDLEVNNSEVVDLDRYGKWANIEFNCLPGYRSCMQAGGTKKSDDEWLEKFGKKGNK